MQVDGASPEVAAFASTQGIGEIRELLGKKAPLRIWPDLRTKTPSADFLGISCALLLDEQGRYLEALEFNNFD
jgi:hypothetical protein